MPNILLKKGGEIAQLKNLEADLRSDSNQFSVQPPLHLMPVKNDRS